MLIYYQHRVGNGVILLLSIFSISTTSIAPLTPQEQINNTVSEMIIGKIFFIFLLQNYIDFVNQINSNINIITSEHFMNIAPNL